MPLSLEASQGMLDFRSLIRTVAILAMFLLAPALHAQEGLSDAFTSVSSSCDFSNRLLGSSVVAADFDRTAIPTAQSCFAIAIQSASKCIFGSNESARSPSPPTCEPWPSRL